MSKKHYDHDAIAELLSKKTITQGEIASIIGCDVQTVRRVARARGLGIGQGMSRWWEYPGMSSELAYIIGFYLCEGNASKDCYTVSFSNSDPVLNAILSNYLYACEIKHGFSTLPGRNRPIIQTRIHSKMFHQWITSICDGKSKIPEIIFDDRRTSWLSFLAACMDGDGTVSRDGSIKIKNTYDWINDLPALLTALGIRSRIVVEEALESGREYRRVSINRSDFLAQGAFCFSSHKIDRIHFPIFGKKLKDSYNRRPQKPM